MLEEVVVLSAPSNLGLMPPPYGGEPGVRRLAQVLKGYDLVTRLGARDGGIVAAPPYVAEPDAETNVRNAHAIRAYTMQLADALQVLLDQKHFCLVLGGDCSILFGPMLALRRRGNYGLIYVDGHRDFQTPAMSATAGAAGMDLALVTGRGPSLLTCYDGFEALLDDEAVVILAHRDPADSDAARALAASDVRQIDLARVRELGPERAAEAALGRMQSSKVDGFWLHLDVDVLNSDEMSAVDSPQPGGLTYADLRQLLLPLLDSSLIVGLNLTIYDPERDKNGDVGRQLANWLIETFRAVK